MYTGDLSLDDYQKTAPFKEADLKSMQERLDRIHDRLAAKGVMFLIVIPPNKNTIYPEHMPKEVPIMGTQSRLDQVTEYEKQHGKTPILDLRPALIEASKSHPVYYSTDTHWNPYGAWVGYREILNVLQKDFPELKPYSLDDYVYLPLGMQPGDIASNLGQVSVEEEHFELALASRKPVDKWIATVGKNQVITTALPGSTLPRLLIFRDSFSDNLAPFLSDNFSRAVYVSSYSIDQHLIDAEKPDIVIYEATERWLSKLFFLQ